MKLEKHYSYKKKSRPIGVVSNLQKVFEKVMIPIAMLLMADSRHTYQVTKRHITAKILRKFIDTCKFVLDKSQVYGVV